MSLAINSLGLLYTSDGATYNGRPISLDNIRQDNTGRFSEAQKAQAKHLGDMQTALSTLETISARQEDENRRDPSGRANRSSLSDSDVVSLSAEAQQHLRAEGSGASAPVEMPTPDSNTTVARVTFSGSLRIGGFTLSASASAETGASKITVTGPDGFEMSDQVFRASWDTASGELSAGPGQMPEGFSYATSKDGNKEYITVTQAVASAATATVSSNNASLSESTVSAESQSTTFVVDFSSGTISAMQADVSATALSATSQPPGA